MEFNSKSFADLDSCSIGIIGLGYVGLPLAVEFARTKICSVSQSQLSRKVVGFDISKKRIKELLLNQDYTKEIDSKVLENTSIMYTDQIDHLCELDVLIVTVPTPIDIAKQPDLSPLRSASKTVGLALKERQKHDIKTYPIVIYESTVYPGATEDFCIPIIENYSGLKLNIDFFCGYSPERINPGDKEHRLPNIKKITSGSSEESRIWINNLYSSIISAGTHMAQSIKVAEAAKVIENTQRDINIALINEFAMIFNLLDIDTLDVLEAAGSKWNFLPFRPGLVGGHCIGIDPYYLTYKAEQVGYHPQIVLAGRRINDSMSRWIAEQVVLKLAQNKISITSCKALVLGATFKENCPDTRNSKTLELIQYLNKYNIDTLIVDPWADNKYLKEKYKINITDRLPEGHVFDLIIVAVKHKEFVGFDVNTWSGLVHDNSLVYDLKGIVPRSLMPIRL